MAKERTETRRGRGFGCLLLLLLPLAALYLARDAVATRAADHVLREKGIECDARFSVAVGADLQTATLERTACIIADPRVERVELTGSSKVELEGLAVARVSVDSLRVVLPERRFGADIGGLGPRWLARLDVGERLGMAIGALEGATSEQVPDCEVGRLDLVRDDETLVTLHGLRRSRGGDAPLLAGRIELRPDMRHVTAELVGVRVTFEGEEMRIVTTLTVDARLPVLGRVSHEMPIEARIGKDGTLASLRTVP